MQKLCFVFGTRPEAIKLSPVILLARQQPQRFEVEVCVTGQHREMLDQTLSIFGIVPDADLELMRPDQSLADISSRTIQAVSKYLEQAGPDWVLVQGDTTTVWSAAVAAFFLNIPVGHVEAGLRTNDKRQPFPEEINRRIATQIADLHFAPTEWAKENLLAEGVAPERIFVLGNPVVDALYWVLEKNEKNPSEDVAAIQSWAGKTLGERPMVLITGHRRESFGEGFENICQAITELAGRHQDVCWVYPVHLNPNVQKQVRQILTGKKNVHLIDPLPYAAFAWLMNRSRFILTDSGGVQEEAPSLGKRVLVMRNKTERPEGVDAGVVTLVGNEKKNIIEHCEGLLQTEVEQLAKANPYGDGHASERILDAIYNYKN
jgi:UDP-N-acetylglucosamine 2-epimerase (non-hydrolysing)